MRACAHRAPPVTIFHRDSRALRSGRRFMNSVQVVFGRRRGDARVSILPLSIETALEGGTMADSDADATAFMAHMAKRFLGHAQGPARGGYRGAFLALRPLVERTPRTRRAEPPQTALKSACLSLRGLTPKFGVQLQAPPLSCERSATAGPATSRQFQNGVDGPANAVRCRAAPAGLVSCNAKLGGPLAKHSGVRSDAHDSRAFVQVRGCDGRRSPTARSRARRRRVRLAG